MRLPLKALHNTQNTKNANTVMGCCKYRERTSRRRGSGDVGTGDEVHGGAIMWGRLRGNGVNGRSADVTW